MPSWSLQTALLEPVNRIGLTIISIFSTPGVISIVLKALIDVSAKRVVWVRYDRITCGISIGVRRSISQIAMCCGFENPVF